MTGITFGSGSQLKTVGENAFSGCARRTGAVAFPDTVIPIDSTAFTKARLPCPTDSDQQLVSLCRHVTPARCTSFATT